MPSQVQPQTLSSKKFMCLEDRFLQALYKSKGPVTLANLASPISITPAAALSIAHRIRKNYPAYLQLEEKGTIDDIHLIASPSQVDAVQSFLDKGGFTKINEDEFVQYYEKELKKERRQALFQSYKEKIKREKWAIGITALVGVGFIITTYLYKLQTQEKI